MTEENVPQNQVPESINWKKDLKEAVLSKKGLYTALLILGLIFGRLGTNYLMHGSHHRLVPVVKVISPQVGPLDSQMTIPGNMEAIEQASLYAHVGGYLKTIYVDEGDHVKKGQLLAQIDAPDIVDEYNRAKAELNLKKVTRDRYNELLKENVISEQEFDTIDAAYDETKAKYDAAASNMAFTQIRAPFDGSIARRYKYPGDLISMSNKQDQQPIFLIVNEGTLRVVLNIPQIEMGHIKEGSSVDIKVDSFPDTIFQGQVTRLDALLDEATKTQRVLVDIDNPDRKLRAGMFASVVVHFDHKDNVLTIPADAVEQDGSDNFVYAYRDGKAEKTPVTLGLKSGEVVEITTGLTADDKVISRGVIALSDGMSVKAEFQKQAVTTPPTPSPAQPAPAGASSTGAVETAASAGSK